jgi:MFS transporter, YNFM family, putative membrane transport protein
MVSLAAAPGAHRVGSRGFRRLTAAVCCAGVASLAGMYCTQALLPALSAYYRISPTISALTVSLTTGMVALCIIPASMLSERYGRTLVMLISAVASSVIGLLLPFSPTLGVLIAGRALQGMALAGVPAVAMAYLAEEVHASSLGSAMGRYVAGTTVGGLIGRIIPSVVLDVSNWRVALLASSLTTLAATVAFAVLVPRSRYFTPNAASPRATLQKLGGHLRNPVLFKLFSLSFVLMGGFVSVYNYLGYRLTAQPFGLASSMVGLLFVLYLAGTWSSAFAGRLVDRRGRAFALSIALPTAVIGLLATGPHAVAMIVVGVGVFTAGFFAAHTVASGWVGAVARQDRGPAAALYMLGFYLGGSVGGALGGLVYSVGGWAATVTFVGALLLSGLLLAGLLVRDTRVRAAE